jgi:ribonuclease HI
MIEIFTDGSCVPNPGNGGWGFAVFEGDSKRLYCGFVEEKTTNNKMELMAITKSIKKANSKYENENITVYTDSDYVKKGLMSDKGVLFEGWIKGWIKKEWKNVKNSDEWKKLYNTLKDTKNNYEVKWVKAHVGNKRNELADKLANKGRELRPH